MLELGKEASSWAAFSTDFYMLVTRKVTGWHEKLVAYKAARRARRAQAEPMTDIEKYQLVVDEVTAALKCDCGGTCPTCQHIIDGVNRDFWSEK